MLAVHRDGGSAAGQVIVFATGATAEPRIYSVTHTTLDVESKEFSDPAVVSAVAVTAGVRVRAMVESPAKYAC